MVESISMDELDGLAVHGETTVGWDENTPPNETVDEDGQPLPIAHDDCGLIKDFGAAGFNDNDFGELSG